MSKIAIELVNPENGQRSCIFVEVNDGFEPVEARLMKCGHGNFEVEVINPRTNEQRKLLVEMSSDQAAAACAAPCLTSFVQTIACRPDGFLFVGNGVRPVTLN